MAGQVITKISASSGTHLISTSFYGTCATAGETAAKVVIVNDPNITDAITLVNGMTLAVKFTSSNAVANPTITVYNNSGTAASPTQGSTTLIAQKSIKKYGTTSPGTLAASSWTSGAIVLFVYDGTNWIESSSWDNDSTSYLPLSGGNLTGNLSMSNKWQWSVDSSNNLNLEWVG